MSSSNFGASRMDVVLEDRTRSIQSWLLKTNSTSLALSRSERTQGGFRRRDAHLYATVAIGLDEALLGFERNITHLDSHVVTLRRHSVTQPGFTETVAGQGMPKPPGDGEWDTFGNLYVEYSVVLPDAIDGDLREGASKSFGWPHVCIYSR